jgi:CTP:molybdopterin cytidylyltransferase MocA
VSAPHDAAAPPAPLRVAAVVLAAGASTRLGRPKQLVVHEGEPLVRRAAAAAAEAGAAPVVVVLGAHAELVAPTLQGLAGVTAVVHEGWRAGLASSLAAGVGVLLAGPPCDAVLVTLADQPLVDARALRRLVAAFSPERRIVAAGYSDTVGVPALFGWEHAAALAALTGDAGAGSWLRRRRDEVTSVALDAAALDVDVPADVARLSARAAPRDAR